MAQKTFRLVLALLLLSCVSYAEQRTDGVAEVNGSEQKYLIICFTTIYSTDFNSTWEHAIKDFKGENVNFRTINVLEEQEEHKKYNLTMIPTVIILKGQEQIATYNGPHRKQSFLMWIDKFVKDLPSKIETEEQQINLPTPSVIAVFNQDECENQVQKFANLIKETHFLAYFSYTCNKAIIKGLEMPGQPDKLQIIMKTSKNENLTKSVEWDPQLFTKDLQGLNNRQIFNLSASTYDDIFEQPNQYFVFLQLGSTEHQESVIIQGVKKYFYSKEKGEVVVFRANIVDNIFAEGFTKYLNQTAESDHLPRVVVVKKQQDKFQAKPCADSQQNANQSSDKVAEVINQCFEQF